MRFIKAISILLLFISVTCKAQTDSSSVKTKNENDKVFTFVEHLPEYPGGDSALVLFLQNNLVYPSWEYKNGIAGKVMLRFTLKADGSVDSVAITNSVSGGLDKEAVRVIRLLRFIPTKQNSEVVDTYFSIPVHFVIDGGRSIEDFIKEKINEDENFRNAIAQYKFQKYEDAIKYLKKSILLFPDNYVSYEMKGECERILGKLKAACKDYQNAIQFGSPDAEALLKKYCD